MPETVLEATAISVTRDSSEILSNVSLTVAADARLLIQGPSGAGKTTLFNILGLLDTPSSGKLTIMGSDASTLPERERARLRRDTIGFIFQDFQLISDLTAWENAAVPQDHTGERDESWLKNLFTQLDIMDLTDQYPATLSGGEKQRVAIARALANRPAIILADEPTGQLDPDTTDKVLELLFEVQESTDTALVTISHDVQLSPLYQDTMFLADGDIVERKVEP